MLRHIKVVKCETPSWIFTPVEAIWSLVSLRSLFFFFRFLFLLAYFDWNAYLYAVVGKTSSLPHSETKYRALFPTPSSNLKISLSSALLGEPMRFLENKINCVPSSPVPELSFLPALYRSWTRAGEKRCQGSCLTCMRMLRTKGAHNLAEQE